MIGEQWSGRLKQDNSLPQKVYAVKVDFRVRVFMRQAEGRFGHLRHRVEGQHVSVMA